LLTIFNPARLDFIFSFLIFMGNTAPALAGVVYTSWFLKRWRSGTLEAWIPWVAWGLGSTVSWLSGGIWALPLGLIIAALVMAVVKYARP
jgi:hypothetical protein